MPAHPDRVRRHYQPTYWDLQRWFIDHNLDLARVSCVGTKDTPGCGWVGRAFELIAQACPQCDGRAREDGSNV